MFLGLYACMCVFVFVCMYVCFNVCMHLYACFYVCMHTYAFVSVSALCVCMCVCMYVCMLYAGVAVFVREQMFVCVFAHVQRKSSNDCVRETCDRKHVYM